MAVNKSMALVIDPFTAYCKNYSKSDARELVPKTVRVIEQGL